MYPRISELIAEINRRGHSSFLVTNGMLPERLEEMERRGQLPTQLYLSLNATDKEMFDLIEHPLYPDAWERLQSSMRIVKRLRKEGRTRTVVRITCIKGRDFEVPACGGLYLTTYNHELASLFDIGKEILCYLNEIDCVEIVRYYLERPEEAKAIARAGYSRCLGDHTWKRRFHDLFQWMGLLSEEQLPTGAVAGRTAGPL